MITTDDRLVACPECGADFSSGEPDRNLLTPQQEKYIVSKIWKRLRKFLFGGFSILTVISVVFLVVALVKAYRSGTNYIENMLVTKITEEFEEPKIRKIMEQVAKAEARSVITNQINPIVKDFKAHISSLKADEINKIWNNHRGAVNQAAYVLGAFRREYSDAHGVQNAEPELVQRAIDCAVFIIRSIGGLF